jgi:hypothetical protein
MHKLATKLYYLLQAGNALSSKIFKLFCTIFLAVDSIPKSNALGAATSGTYRHRFWRRRRKKRRKRRRRKMRKKGEAEREEKVAVII